MKWCMYIYIYICVCLSVYRFSPVSIIPMTPIEGRTMRKFYQAMSRTKPAISTFESQATDHTTTSGWVDWMKTFSKFFWWSFYLKIAWIFPFNFGLSWRSICEISRPAPGRRGNVTFIHLSFIHGWTWISYPLSGSARTSFLVVIQTARFSCLYFVFCTLNDGISQD